ncbi:MAG TPA: VWA domain-containing protein [Candidatus Acidoferrales bacterium]|jgi:Ca-activated chloride channel family protein|nr:VWA domain-containing protein [Candidatus Acidoferrales bacterium]
MRPSLGVCLAGLMLSAGGRAQTSIRVDVSLVSVGFSVRDARGNLVTNLTQDDVELTEDGVPQRIAFFGRSADVPLNLGLIMDVSGSQQSFVKPHLKDLEAFLKSVMDEPDRAFLICFANRVRLVSDYSSSGKELVAALRQFEKGKGNAEYPIVGPPEYRILGTAFYDAIYEPANLMFPDSTRGRRALVIFSDGEDNSSAHHMLETIEAAQANDVTLFCLRYTEPGRNGRVTARNKYGAGVMARISRETGGLDFDARAHGLQEGFRQIGAQLRSSYELGYHTSNPSGDKTFHKISIRTKQAGLEVRAKTGYYSR